MIDRNAPGFPDFVKSAFLYHWNLLAVGAGTVFALLTGHADLVLPLVAAAEITYLAALATRPRFQRAIASEWAARQRGSSVGDAERRLQNITSALAAGDLRHFEALRARCVRLQQIASGMKGEGHGSDLENYRAGGMDRLLWTFLKLLYAKTLLQQFLDSTEVSVLEREAASLEGRLAALGEATADDPTRQKVRRSLEDTIATVKGRVENYKQAVQNLDFVKLEITRIENKINSISEVAVNRQDPDYISAQVDSVAQSMTAAEKTMSDLNLFAVEARADEEPPPFLRREIQ